MSESLENEDAIRKRVELVLQQVQTEENLGALGKVIAEQIKKRTRLGYGVEEQGDPQQKLKALSDDYKDWRKKNKGKLSSATTVSKSNLTQTGEMLDSIQSRVEGKSIILYFSTAFARAKARWVTDGGRPFFTLSGAEIQSVRKRVLDLIAKAISATK